ncbi:hypothetical protein Y1Q_0017229 [Alligator mississippiensis]|uniref:Uncharacterized protein n=1 Tax=Alligator mississippiensis TaxID=8496 RepID=A0A151NKU0_ALLMI|nr:hypothetical protein Y1Q_0017229 [Alligator mississippiensis]
MYSTNLSLKHVVSPPSRMKRETLPEDLGLCYHARSYGLYSLGIGLSMEVISPLTLFKTSTGQSASLEVVLRKSCVNFPSKESSWEATGYKRKKSVECWRSIGKWPLDTM